MAEELRFCRLYGLARVFRLPVRYKIPDTIEDFGCFRNPFSGKGLRKVLRSAVGKFFDNKHLRQFGRFAETV